VSGLRGNCPSHGKLRLVLKAGGTSEGEPAVRHYFGPGYYAANIGDFDGNHLEIVNKDFNPPSRPSR
jgi:hypothetical protein